MRVGPPSKCDDEDRPGDEKTQRKDSCCDPSPTPGLRPRRRLNGAVRALRWDQRRAALEDLRAIGAAGNRDPDRLVAALGREIEIERLTQSTDLDAHDAVLLRIEGLPS